MAGEGRRLRGATARDGARDGVRRSPQLDETRKGRGVHPGDDADLADFFSLNELPPLAFHSTQQIIDRIS